MGRISQPIWDRFDLSVKVGKVDFDMLVNNDNVHCSDEYSSDNMKNMVERARGIQKERFSKEKILFNAQMNSRLVAKYCFLGTQEKAIMEKAFNSFNMTARGYEKILKTARTIADMEGKENIAVSHLGEAISYRNNGIR